MSKYTVKVTKKMPCVDAVPEMGSRVAFWLRQAYPRNTVKEVARAVDSDERTVREWLEGKYPSGKHISRLSGLFGYRFVAFVFEPACGDTAMLRIRGELDDLQKEHAQLADRILQARADFDGIRAESDRPLVPVSYTHLTLPTIYSV